MSFKIRKGDTVVVLSGKDRGKSGKVLRILTGKKAALVERLNLTKHFERRTQENPNGGVVERETPMALSKLAVLCPKTRKPARVGWRVNADNSKQRLSRQSGEIL